MTRRVYQVVLFLTLAVCTFLFAKEVQHSGIRFEHADKVAHFGIFFVLAFFTHHATRLPIWIQLCLLTGYGVGIEYMQDSLPYRQASIGDFIADFLGAASYYLGYMAWHSWRAKENG